MYQSRLHPSSPRRARALTSAVLSLCLFTGAGYAFAADDPEQKKSKVDQQLSEAKGDLQDTSEDLVKAHDTLKSTRAKLPAARTKSKDAEDAETTAKAEHDDAASAHTLAQANEEKAEKQLRSTSSKITKARRAVAGFAGQVYQEQGLGSLSVAVGTEDPSDFVDKVVMAESAGDSQGSALEDLSTNRANLVSAGDRLSALRAKTKSAKETKETKLSEASAAKDAADAAKADLESLESDQTIQAADLRREKSKDETRVKSLEMQSDKLTKQLEERARKARVREEQIKKAREEQAQREAEARERARKTKPSPSSPSRGSGSSGSGSSGSGSGSGGSSSGSGSSAPAPAPAPAPPPPDPNPAPPPSSATLQAPGNAPVSSEFGLRFHPIHSTWRVHAGRDYAGACGTPVRSAASGTIVSALSPGPTGGYGNQVVIDHGVHRGTSLATTYNHLQSFAVRGGRVSRGQVIGYVGTTGTSTGCHLHFETRANGTPVDPRGWL